MLMSQSQIFSDSSWSEKRDCQTAFFLGFQLEIWRPPDLERISETIWSLHSPSTSHIRDEELQVERHMAAPTWASCTSSGQKPVADSQLQPFLRCQQRINITSCWSGFCFYFFFFIFYIVVDFVIPWNETAMGLHVFPILIPPPTSLSTRSLWVFPVHQVQALVSCIQPGLVICFTLDNTHVSMLFSWNIPPSPSPTESERLFYTSVSLFLFCIEGYH